MTPLEIGILIGAIALVVFTVVFNVVRKLRGHSGCGCATKTEGTQEKKKKHACTGACSDCGAECPYRNQ